MAHRNGDPFIDSRGGYADSNNILWDEIFSPEEVLGLYFQIWRTFHPKFDLLTTDDRPAEPLCTIPDETPSQ